MLLLMAASLQNQRNRNIYISVFLTSDDHLSYVTSSRLMLPTLINSLHYQSQLVHDLLGLFRVDNTPTVPATILIHSSPQMQLTLA